MIIKRVDDCGLNCLDIKGCKVDNPYLVTLLMKTPIFECYVSWCGFKYIFTQKKHVKKRLDCVLKI